MQTEILPANHPSALTHALDVLNHGGLVAFPTDTVYGLAAPVFNANSIERLYIVKGRNHSKAIAVLLSGAEQLDQIAINVSENALRLAQRFWPGPLTLIVPRHPALPKILAPESTIGVRVPDHPVALSLLNLTGPLAVTSANQSEKKNARTAREVMAQLNGRIHLILDGGKTPGGVPSTVVDCTTLEVKILRPGPLNCKTIFQIVLPAYNSESGQVGIASISNESR
ncbi:MAG: threonylcarbamoyl-AMP synthase [Chloroflexi bacterium]|nr:threonylcarbamoyl-AMP synthase [Chloroflexota bacterium]MBU1660978.1 threonylcarbamoyl-AMP synthase [Chloroflexota bacterium]